MSTEAELSPPPITPLIPPQTANEQKTLLRVIRRNGQVTPYNEEKIIIAITKAFLATEGEHAADSARIHETVRLLTQQVTTRFYKSLPKGGTIPIEDIQDQVELALMRHGAQPVARAYVLYREERRLVREARNQQQINNSKPLSGIHIIQPNGIRTPIENLPIHDIIRCATANLPIIDTPETHEALYQDTLRNLFDGATLADVDKALIMCARQRIEVEPDFSFVAARMLMNELQRQALPFVGISSDYNTTTTIDYKNYFTKFIHKGIEQELLDKKLANFDLDTLAAAIQPKRDTTFNYLSLQTLFDRYFLHKGDVRFELPQAFFMRIAMGLALNEENKEHYAIEFYNTLSSFDFMSSTPTLFNSGTPRSQLSSCYLTTIPDDLAGIYSAMKDNALLSKYAGGLGNDWTPVRAMGAHIKGTNGKSQGSIPFMKVANDTAVAVNQGGKRKGAICAYLETWHLDIEEFLELRKNTGDERRRTHDMNTANWIPDLFMKRINAQQDWTLFSPNEVPDLHNLYGKEFEEAYIAYEQQARDGNIKNFKVISAMQLWRKMLSMLFETAHPWITFKDPANLRSPQQHCGVVHSSNLCTEITLNTSQDEIAVCNLGSINLAQHINKEGLDVGKLEKTITTAIRMLDNVININFYSVIQARRSNMQHRPIGLGLMGFQDALYMQNICYESTEAVDFADESMEWISYFAIQASCKLAQEREPYPSFEGSLWSKGVLPIDSIKLLAQNRQSEHMKQNTELRLDWDTLRTQVMRHGMRNSNVMAIAPTATISNICGVSQSIEPTYQNLFVKSNLSGEFTIVNPHLVKELKANNLWDSVMSNDLKYYDGRITAIDRIPEHIKSRFKTAFEIDPHWLIQAASRRQKWIDQGQSLNLYMATPSGKKLNDLYQAAWIYGLKTTYYLRSLGATSVEKSTLADGALNAVKINTPKTCAIDDPDCEACQ